MSSGLMPSARVSSAYLRKISGQVEASGGSCMCIATERLSQCQRECKTPPGWSQRGQTSSPTARCASH
eukprot:6490473-Amphidinium_carterae.2